MLGPQARYGAFATAQGLHGGVEVLLIQLRLFCEGVTDRAVPLLEEAGVAALVAARVQQPPPLPCVEGHVAAGTEAIICRVLHQPRDQRHIWGERVLVWN